MSASDFEKELERQIADNFIPDGTGQKHVIYKVGHEVYAVTNNQ